MTIFKISTSMLCFY